MLSGTTRAQDFLTCNLVCKWIIYSYMLLLIGHCKQKIYRPTRTQADVSGPYSTANVAGSCTSQRSQKIRVSSQTELSLIQIPVQKQMRGPVSLSSSSHSPLLTTEGWHPPLRNRLWDIAPQCHRRIVRSPTLMASITEKRPPKSSICVQEPP